MLTEEIFDVRCAILEKKAASTFEPIKRLRFLKQGENADHPITTRLRAIKDNLHLTTLQFVNEINAYERAHQSHNFHGKIDDSPSWLPLTSVLVSSYLQGYVMQTSYMELMLQRFESFFSFKNQSGQILKYKDIRKIIDGWFDILKITEDSGSRTRHLGRMIAPYYKRPVLAGISGTFFLGEKHEDVQNFTIVDNQEVSYEFCLNANEPILVKNKSKIRIGDVIQYSVLMYAAKNPDVTVITHEPSVNHTTFYRWYTQNKMPRSIKTIELVDAAVKEAAKNMA